MRELSQHDKILRHMKTDPTRWWLPADFVHPALVGYEASARLSELAKLGKVESRQQGKFIARRLIVKQPVAPVVTRPTPKKVDEVIQAALFDLPVAPQERRMFG